MIAWIQEGNMFAPQLCPLLHFRMGNDEFIKKEKKKKQVMSNELVEVFEKLSQNHKTFPREGTTFSGSPEFLRYVQQEYL